MTTEVDIEEIIAAIIKSYNFFRKEDIKEIAKTDLAISIIFQRKEIEATHFMIAPLWIDIIDVDLSTGEKESVPVPYQMAIDIHNILKPLIEAQQIIEEADQLDKTL